MSILHHVQDEHVWLGGRCEHEPLTGPPTDRDGNEIPYFQKSEQALHALRKLVMDKRWLESMKYYTKFRLVNAIIHLIYNTYFLVLGILECWKPSIVLYWDIALRDLLFSKLFIHF